MTMTRTAGICCLGVLLSLSAFAQDPGATPPPTADEAAGAPLETVPVQDTEPEAPVDFIHRWFPAFDLSWGGFVRTEVAASADPHANPANQFGNPFNGRSIARQAYTPPALGAPGSKWGDATLTASDSTAPGVRPFTSTTDNKFNYSVLRTELTADISFTPSLTLKSRLRTLYDPGQLYKEFSGDSLDFDRGGIAGGDPSLYRG